MSFESTTSEITDAHVNHCTVDIDFAEQNFISMVDSVQSQPFHE